MNERDRDSAMERLLRETLASEPAVESPACLDPETLAAWSEGVLPDHARASAEAHVSNCARCQAMLAVMARTLPAASPSTGPSVRKWLMMLSPALAAAAAVLVWFAVDHRPAPSVAPQVANARATEEAGAPAAAPPVELRPRSAPEAESGRLADEKGADAEKRRANEPAQYREGATANKTGEIAKEKKLERDRDANSKRAAAESSRIAAALPSAPAPPPPVAPAEPLRAGERQQVTSSSPPVATAPPPPLQQAAQSQAPATQQSQAAGQTLADAAKPIDRVDQLPRSSDAAAFGGRGGAGARTEAAKTVNETIVSRSFVIPDVTIASPDRSVQWQVAGGRTIRQSIDGGATWATQYSADSAVTLTAGAAPSATVCWIVGRAGAVLVTTDGRTWKRVAFPETIDLASVTAADGRTATVTAAGNRIFATSDGGLTWSRR